MKTPHGSRWPAFALVLLASAALRADFTDQFSHHEPESPLANAYAFNVGERDTSGRGKYVLDGTGLKIWNATGNHGIFWGVVPSLVIREGKNDTWKISTKVSFDWYGENNLDGAGPSGGLVVFADDKNFLTFSVTHHGASDADYFEIQFGDSGAELKRVSINTLNARRAPGGSVPYTLSIEKQASGTVVFSYASDEKSGTLLILAPDHGEPEKGVRIVNPNDGRLTGSLPEYGSMYSFLDTLAGKQVGLFVNPHLYGVDNPDKRKFAGNFSLLEIIGLDVAE
jgi:hypothetical protein